MSEDLTNKLPPNANEKLTLVLSTVQAVAVRVDNLEQSVKVALYETRPVLQKVIADIGKLQEGVHRLEQGQETLRSELRAFRRDVNHRFTILSGTVLERYTKLEQRVTRLELNSSPPNTET